MFSGASYEEECALAHVAGCAGRCGEVGCGIGRVGRAGAEPGAADGAEPHSCGIPYNTSTVTDEVTVFDEEAVARSHRRANTDTPFGGGPCWGAFGAPLAGRRRPQCPFPTRCGNGCGWFPRLGGGRAAGVTTE